MIRQTLGLPVRPLPHLLVQLKTPHLSSSLGSNALQERRVLSLVSTPRQVQRCKSCIRDLVGICAVFNQQLRDFVAVLNVVVCCPVLFKQQVSSLFIKWSWGSCENRLTRGAQSQTVRSDGLNPDSSNLFTSSRCPPAAAQYKLWSVDLTPTRMPCPLWSPWSVVEAEKIDSSWAGFSCGDVFTLPVSSRFLASYGAVLRNFR